MFILSRGFIAIAVTIAHLTVNVRKYDKQGGARVIQNVEQLEVLERLDTKSQPKEVPPQLIQTSLRVSASNVQSISKLVGGVHARKVWRTATKDEALAVSFAHSGKEYHFELVPHNVYAEKATVVVGGQSFEARSSPTFKARDVGSWASVTWHDGQVHGIFEDKGRLMEVKPVSQHHDQDIIPALLEQYTGDHAPHIIEWVEPHSLINKFIDDTNEVPENTTDAGPIEQEAAIFGFSAMNAHDGGTWGGNPWTPGCYNGDTAMHELVLSIASDHESYQWKNRDASAVQTLLESLVHEASFVYEKQVNIQLKIGYLEIATDTSKFGACPTAVDDCTDKLEKIKNAVRDGQVPAMAANHLFTACGEQYGVIGLAYGGSVCAGEWATASNKIHTRSPWLTFAHELGHNLNGLHSFEEGQGRTGGIMDYGDGKLNGHYQFNSRYRKQAMCDKLNQNVGGCNGHFKLASASAPAPTPEPTAQPTGSSSGGTGRHRRRRSGGSSSGGSSSGGTGQRFTQEGCPCMQRWATSSGQCLNYCCLAGDSADWCFHATSCGQSNWGYCV